MLERISSLVDDNLMTQLSGWEDGPRFALLETIREYGLERLERSGDKGLVERQHSVFFLAMAEQAKANLYGPDQARWLARLAAERGNLQTALERAITTDDADTALRLGSALWGYWAQRGHLAEGRTQLEKALEIDTNVDPAVRARAIHYLGTLALDLSDFSGAREHFAQSLTIWKGLNHQYGIASALNGLGLVARDLGEYADARRCFEEALTIWSTIEADVGVAVAQHNLGTVATAEGSYALARDCHEEALTIRRQLGDSGGVAYSLWAIAMAARLGGDTERAEAQLRESIEIFRSLNDLQGEALVLYELARVAQQTGDDLKALVLLRDTLTLRKSLGEHNWMAEAIEAIAAVVIRRGHVERAVRLFGAMAPLRAKVATAPTKAERREREQTFAIAHRAMTESVYARAWAAGQALSLEQATAEALLLTEETEIITRPPAPFNLTRREQEVLALLCQHLTDAEIAARLFLSPRTASNHVASIVDKLGVANRREAAALAIRHGLV